MSHKMITENEREAFYKVLHGRRDVRRQFLPKPIPDQVLERILDAAHHAGSVGYMQPWNFIVIQDRQKRSEVRDSFLKEREEAAKLFDEQKRKKYLSYKLEGILESPLNLIVTCDPDRQGPQVIGRRSMPETDTYSTVCAVQNLWLAARAENIGTGWVSILKKEDLYRIFHIPSRIMIVAYLCMGYVTHFEERPDLETLNWAERLPLENLVFYEKWDGNQDPLQEDE